MPAITVDTAIERSGFGLSQFIYIAASCTIFYVELLSLVSDGVLLPIIKCEWNLTSFEASGYLLSTRIAFGLGGVIGGKLGDLLGRRLSIMMGLVFQITMTTIALNSYSLGWYVFFHALNKIAFGVVMPSAHALAIEICPANKRFAVKICFGIAGNLGACSGAFVSGFYEQYGWRSVQLMTSIPCCVAFISFYLLDPSPRFLVVQGKLQQAESVIKNIYKRNGKVLHDQFSLSKEANVLEARGSYKDLFVPSLRHQSYKLMYMVAIKGFFVTTIHISIPYILGGLAVNEHHTDCSSFTSKSYIKMIIMLLPDILIHPSILTLAQSKGRKRAINIAFLVASMFLCMSSFLEAGNSVFSLCVGIGLGSVSSARSVIVLYTAELYPTTMRGVANGMIWSADNIGSFAAPFLVEYLVLRAPRLFVFIAACAVLTCTFVSRTLKRETLNQPLLESMSEVQNSERGTSPGKINVI